jgi:hypothetical protein
MELFAKPTLKQYDVKSFLFRSLEEYRETKLPGIEYKIEVTQFSRHKEFIAFQNEEEGSIKLIQDYLAPEKQAMGIALEAIPQNFQDLEGFWFDSYNDFQLQAVDEMEYSIYCDYNAGGSIDDVLYEELWIIYPEKLEDFYNVLQWEDWMKSRVIAALKSNHRNFCDGLESNLICLPLSYQDYDLTKTNIRVFSLGEYFDDYEEEDIYQTFEKQCKPSGNYRKYCGYFSVNGETFVYTIQASQVFS